MRRAVQIAVMGMGAVVGAVSASAQQQPLPTLPGIQRDPAPSQQLPPLPPGALPDNNAASSTNNNLVPPPQFGGSVVVTPQQTVFGARALQGQAPNPTQAAFPALPPADPCSDLSIRGTWKMVAVYEVPLGAQTDMFNKYPMQYIRFGEDTTYGEYNAQNMEMDFQTANSFIARSVKEPQQYLVRDKGMVYFYRNSVAVDTQACFIVAKDKNGFYSGEMLLMPPEGQYSGRLVKVYARMQDPALATRPLSNPRAQTRRPSFQRGPVNDVKPFMQ